MLAEKDSLRAFAFGRARKDSRLPGIVSGDRVSKPMPKGFEKRLWRWVENTRAVGKQVLDDHLFGHAAEIAFYELIALVPLFGLLMQLVSLLPRQGVMDRVLEVMARYIPAQAVTLIENWLSVPSATGKASLLSAGAVVMIWVGSAAVGAFVDALDKIYHLEGRIKRPFVHRATVRVTFTLFGGLALLVLVFLQIVVPPLLEFFLEAFRLEAAWAWAWHFVRGPVVLLGMVLGLCCFYHFLEPLGLRWRDHLPGAFLGTMLFLISSALFSLYVSNVANFDAVYGGMGALVVFLFWLQFLNLSVLIGASWNAQSCGSGSVPLGPPDSPPRYKPPV
ncbi:MAG: YihY/virulence factor BrkB family protein [Candidatus Hydrogenedentota bacterium]|nr:MAG: YihY/virulence factor BrkB family protein [Candidatus Hydrogenedentota bacterium]